MPLTKYSRIPDSLPFLRRLYISVIGFLATEGQRPNGAAPVPMLAGRCPADRVDKTGALCPPAGKASPRVKYVSTRGQAPALGFSDVLLAGLARDGGLYVPRGLAAA